MFILCLCVSDRQRCPGCAAQKCILETSMRYARRQRRAGRARTRSEPVYASAPTSVTVLTRCRTHHSLEWTTRRSCRLYVTVSPVSTAAHRAPATTRTRTDCPHATATLITADCAHAPYGLFGARRWYKLRDPTTHNEKGGVKKHRLCGWVPDGLGI